MTPLETLHLFARRFDSIGARWMLVGSVAGSFYGLGRSTLDIDLVVDLKSRPPVLIARSVEPEYFIDEVALQDAATSGAMVNGLVAEGVGFKVDLNPLGSDPFDRAAFARRRREDWLGVPVSIITPSDLVISKLRWAAESGSERQLADVRQIMAMELFDEHDADFQQWLTRLGLRDVLDASRSARHDA
jgi:hypothetical protein